MFEENEKEVIEAEEIKEETKKEETNETGKPKYHLIKENFNKALTWAIIGLGIQTVVWILTAIFGTVIEDNIYNLLNCITLAAGCAGVVFVGVVELRLFINKTNPAHTEDIASFIISLVAFIVAFLTAIGFFGSSISSLVDFFRNI